MIRKIAGGKYRLYSKKGSAQESDRDEAGVNLKAG